MACTILEQALPVLDWEELEFLQRDMETALHELSSIFPIFK